VEDYCSVSHEMMGVGRTERSEFRIILNRGKQLPKLAPLGPAYEMKSLNSLLTERYGALPSQGLAMNRLTATPTMKTGRDLNCVMPVR
jgi:hypothetical protein